MTRINCGIPVEALTDEHLLAEHREIKRLPDSFIKALSSGALNRIPPTYRLGTGHVTFFLNKQLYVYARYGAIYNECLRRGFKVTPYFDNWHRLLNKFKEYRCWNNYYASPEDSRITASRIIDRLRNGKKPYYHYRGEPIHKYDMIDNLLIYLEI